MNDLLSKIAKVSRWADSERVRSSGVRVSISGKRIVFFSIKTETSGNFATILDLGHCSASGLQKEMEKNLSHIERIGQKYLNKKGK